MSDDRRWMQLALNLAGRGEGFVEPNPMVGCVLVRHGQLIGEGWHDRFGGPHAEIRALSSCEEPAGATAYITLEPCCHHGKTPPCTDALIEAGIRKVIVATNDPFASVSGQGVQQLIEAGVDVVCGVMEKDANELNRAYFKRIQLGMPWVMAKWAMTLDGKIATVTGRSQWISGEQSRAAVHQLRGRVDAILIGAGTALADDPLLTARPAGPRIATRIVLDSHARLPLESKLVQTAKQVPVIVAVGPDADAGHYRRLERAGCEIMPLLAVAYPRRCSELLKQLASRDFTNVLVEGGSGLLGALVDGRLIDEIHCFIGSQIVGGQIALSPVGGDGIANMTDALQLQTTAVKQLDTDIYVTARVLPAID